MLGTSRFKNPIELLSQKVEELNDLRVEKLNRVKLVEKEKDDLAPAMKAALGFIRLENEKTVLLFRQRCRYIWDAENNITRATDKKNEIEASASDLTEKLKVVIEERKAKDEEMKEKGKAFEKIEKEVEELKAVFTKLEIEDSSLSEEIKTTNARRKKTKTQVEKEKETKEKLENLPEENQRKIDECVELRDKLEKKVEEEEIKYEEAMTTLKTDTQVYQDEKAEHESRLVDLKKSVNEAAAELDLANNEHAVYTSAEVKEKNRLEDLNQRIETNKNSVKDKKVRLVELEESIPVKEQELQGAESELEQVSRNSERINHKLHDLRQDYNEKKSSQQQSKSHGQVFDSLMQQKRNGNIPGIIGRIGDLGGIDKKYDVAVSTAGYSALDTILCEDRETGKACINFLKKHNIGRCNFLAINVTEGKYDRMMEPQETPQNVPRLFDLIRVSEERFRPAFYHYLRDTLVARDMDQANQVAFGARRYRTVTLGGELIETSGTMTGGGRSKFSGKMGQQSAVADKISPKEFEKLERSISDVETEARDLESRKKELDEFVYKTKKEVQEMKKQLGKLRIEVNPLEEQVSMLEKQVCDQEKRVKEAAPDQKKVEKMQSRIDSAQQEYDDANERAQVVERDVKACDAKIKEITGGKIKGIQKKLDDAKKQLEKVKSEITRLEVEIKSSSRNLQKCADKIETLQNEILECQETMKSKDARRKEIEKEGEAILEENNKKTEAKEELQGIIAEMKKEVDVILKKETEMKKERIDVDQQLQKWDDAIKDNTKKVSYWKRDIKKLDLQEVPGEEATSMPELTDEEISNINMQELEYDLTNINENLAKSKPNMAAIAEYKMKEEVYLERVAELDKITSARDDQRKHHDDIRKQRLNDFMEGLVSLPSYLTLTLLF